MISRLICADGDSTGMFITNFPARGWLDYEILRRQRDDLIMVNLVGRRDGGSEVDYTVNPQTGLPFVTGPTTFPRPVNHLLPAWDCIAGQMAAVGLLAAERHRRLTGDGQLVRIRTEGCRPTPDISSRGVHRPREFEMIILRQMVARVRCGVRCRRSVFRDSSNSKGLMAAVWLRRSTAVR